MTRRWLLLFGALLLAAGLGPTFLADTTDGQTLRSFAAVQGLHDVEPFIETVQTLRTTGNLPPSYITKGQANAGGWHGGGLCTLWPGRVIGGDALRNFEPRLGADRGETFYEADLDSNCNGRGPKRLIFSRSGAVFVTTDHYQSFVRVPREPSANARRDP